MITQDIVSNLCIIGDKIYFLNRDGYLVAINRYSSLEDSRVKFSPEFDMSKQISSYSVACDMANNVLAISFSDNTQIMGYINKIKSALSSRQGAYSLLLTRQLTDYPTTPNASA